MPARAGDVGRIRHDRDARGSGRGGRRLRRLVALAAAVATGVAGGGLVVAGPAAAATPACTITFVGSSGGAWSTAANWNPVAVPGSPGRTADRVCIPQDKTVVHDSGDYTVAGFGTAAGTSGGLTGTEGNVTITGSDGSGSWLGVVTLNRVNLFVSSGVLLTTGGLAVNKSTTLSGGGTLSGSGSVTVDGDISVVGGSVSTGNMVITQSDGHAVTIASDGAQVADIRSTTISTKNPVSVTGGLFLFAATIATADQLVLTPGANVTGANGVLSAGGVVTSAGAAVVTTNELRITGTSSALGADLTAGGLGVTATGSLTIPEGRTVALDQTTWPVTTAVAGTITGAGRLAMVSSTMNVTATGTVSVGELSMSGGTLWTVAGATVSLGTYTATWGTWYNDAAVAIGSGGFNVLSGIGGQGNYSGAATGSIALDGDLLVSGGFVSTSNQVVTQTAGHTAVIESRLVAPGTTRSPRWQSVKLTTSDDVTLRGNVELFAGRITTTTDLVVENGTTFGYSNGTLEARGIVTGTTAVGLNDSTLKLTGTSSSVGGSLTVSTLELISGSRLLLPAGGLLKTVGSGTLTVPQGATFGGSGTFDGTLTNNGTLSPGDTPAGAGTGTLTTARYQQGVTGVLDVDVDAAGNDKVDATDTTFGNRPVLDGTLSISRLGGYTPPVGAELTVLTSGVTPVLSGLISTDDLGDGHFGAPFLSGTAVVVSRGPLTTTAPSAPTLTLSPGVESISATVGAPASDGGSPVTGYVVTCSPTCGSHPLATPGTVSITGLTGGVTYTVSAAATNAVGTGSATTADATPLAPTTTATPTKTKLVLSNSATSGLFTVSCTRNSGLVTACSVVAKASNGTVLGVGGPVSVPAGATSIPVTVKLTAAGLSASKAFGGVRATVTSTVTPQSGSVATATSTIQIVRATTKKQVLVSAMFSSGGTLTSAGKTALTAIARQAAGGKVLRCDGYWSANATSTTAYKLGLDRATKACAYIKATITRLALKPIAKYVTYSYGRTKQVKGTTTQNRRIVFTLSS